MSALPPTSLQGTVTVSPVEQLWERYRPLILTVVAAAVAALGIHYGLKHYERRKVDARWSTFAASLNITDIYTDPTKAADSLQDRLASLDASALQGAIARADSHQKPFLLLALARRTMMDGNWDQAEMVLQQLESEYPKHSLVVSNSMPVQARDRIEPKEDETPAARRKQEWQPAVAGSAVSLMREQIAAARQFRLPEAFARPEVPADAPRVKFDTDFGSFVIALMPQAPAHRDKFLELAGQDFWKDIAVDEIQRPARGMKMPHAMHLGYESTREADREKWTTTEPSKHVVEFEDSKLSHFPGAVSARPEADGKSCADRFWITVEDAARFDGERVVFGFVVDGLDTVQRICEAAMSAQEEERGMGRPSETIRVVSTAVLEGK